jgi:hypothetical protein
MRLPLKYVVLLSPDGYDYSSKINCASEAMARVLGAQFVGDLDDESNAERCSQVWENWPSESAVCLCVIGGICNWNNAHPHP